MITRTKLAVFLVIATVMITPQTVLADQASIQAAKQDEKLAVRLQNRKDKMTQKLTIEQKLSLASKCAAAQTKLKISRDTIKETALKRTEKYSNLVVKLEATSKTLSERSIDVTKIDESIKSLKLLIDTFQKDLEMNKQAMSDLSDMNCASDPESFKATLEEARSSLIAVRADSLKIHTYLSETIKPLLKDLKNQLETSSKNPEEIQ